MRSFCCTVALMLLFAICYLHYTIIFTYVSGVSRSMKRQFAISDCAIGWLYAAAGLAYAVTVTITGYFGGQARQRTRWVGGGFLIIAFGCLVLVISAYVAPLPLVEAPKDERRFWNIVFSPLSREDIMTSNNLANASVSQRFPAGVRDYLRTNDFRLDNTRNRRSYVWPKDKRELAQDTISRLRRELYFENGDEYGSPSQHRVIKRELPEWEFPDALKEKLTSGFIGAIFGFYHMEMDTYDRFAETLYNLTNDPEIAERIMKASRLPFGYCRNASSIVRGKVKEEQCLQKPSWSAIFGLLIAFIGFALIGIGSTAIWTVGVALLDDELRKINLACCLASIFGLQALSFIVGVVMGLLAEMKAYFNFNPPHALVAIDPRWVGAWWLGFAVIAIILAIPALIFFLCIKANRNINDAKSYSSTPTNENDQFLTPDHGQNFGTWKGFVYAIFDVCRPPIFVALLLALTFDALALKGYFNFLPKFFENNYSPSIWKSALPFWLYSVGVMVGGFVFRFSRLDGRKAAFFVVACTLIAALLSMAQSHSSLNCTNVVRRVQEVGLANSSNGRPNWPTCHGCICDSAEFYPVCANNSESTPYYSPCHAGCTNFTYEVVGTNVEFHFDYCFCAPARRMRVSRDSCKDDCSGSTRTYLILACLAALMSGAVIVPVIIFVLRTALYRLRALSLGVIGSSVCVFGLLPSTLIYSFLADSTCFLWRTTCPSWTGQNPTCEIFDGPLLRSRLHLFLGVLRLVSVLFYSLVMYHAKGVSLYVQGNRVDSRETEMSGSSPYKDEPSKNTDTAKNNLIGKL